MSNPTPTPNKFLRFALIFTIALLALQLLTGKDKETTGEDVDLVLDKDIALGKVIEVQIKNNLKSPITLPNFCPKNPLEVRHYQNGEWLNLESEVKDSNCSPSPIQIKGGGSYKLSYGPWNSELFGELGRYQISLNLNLEGKERIYSQEIEVTSPSIFRTLWQEGLYKPILNILLFLIMVVPGKNLGVAVILLTLLIKLALVFPNHKALKAQKQMQKVQPQLEALKLKHKDNPQKLAQETMGIYKKYKVNPASSCLPMLIQFPILIALFYVVRGGLASINPDFLYSSIQSLDLSTVKTHFLWLDLTKVNWHILPIIVGGLQFLQMKMTLGKSMGKQIQKKGESENPMVMMNKGMVYIMPLMVAVFTATVPAAVGLYWGTSTLFGIAQQMVVNREKNGA